MIDEIVAALVEAVSMDGLIGSNQARFSAHVRQASSAVCPSLFGDSDVPIQDSQVAYFWRHLANDEEFEVVVTHIHQDEISQGERGAVAQVTQEEEAEGNEAPLGWHDEQRAMPTLRAEGRSKGSTTATNRLIVDMDEDGTTHKGDMMSLIAKYGDNVRLRACLKRSYYALFGSHNKIPGVSPSIFRVLELVARKRSEGASVVEIGKKLGFKQTSVFYVVKFLADAGLVAKIKFLQGRSYTNLVVHHKFVRLNREYNARADTLGGHNATALHLPEDSKNVQPVFSPFGPRELRIPQFVRSRLVQLLESNHWHHLVENKGILRLLGYHDASKREKRDFQRLLQRMIKEGQIDVIFPPQSSRQNASRRWIRLAKFRTDGPEDLDAGWEASLPAVGAPFDNLPAEDDGDEDAEAEADMDGEDDLDELFGDDLPAEKPNYPTVVPIEYIMIQMINSTGENGVTISELSNGLDRVDSKTIEAIVNRAETSNLTPPTLLHLSLNISTENEGRERHLRVHTTPAFLEQLEARNIPTPPEHNHPATFFDAAGSWVELNNDQLYITPQQYRNHVSNFPLLPNAAAVKAWRKGSNNTATAQALRKRGRPKNIMGGVAPKDEGGEVMDDASAIVEVPPKGRPRKYIKLVGSSGKLVKRKRKLEIPVHPELPTEMLYNETTGVFFNLPDSWSGKGPVELPSDWETKTSPKQLVVPSTGKSSVEKEKTGGPKKQVDKRKYDPAASDGNPPARRAKVAKTNAIDPATRRSTNSLTTSGAGDPIPIDIETSAPAEDILPPQKNGNRVSKGSRAAEALPSAEVNTDAITTVPSVLSAGRGVCETEDALSDSAGVGASNAHGSVRLDPIMATFHDEEANVLLDTTQSATPLPKERTLAILQQNVPSKRPLSASPSPSLREVNTTEESCTTKRVKLENKTKVKKTRADMSSVLKQREILRCIEDLGGIVEGGYALIKTYSDWALLQAKLRSEDPSNKSAPKKVFSVDRRTMNRFVDALVADKQIRQTLVGINEATGGNRTIAVLSVVGMDQGRINEFVINQRIARSTKQQSAASRQVLSNTLPSRGSAAQSVDIMAALTTPLAEIEGLSALEVRNLFLRDFRLIPQLYGFKVGKYRRAQTFHGELFGYSMSSGNPAEGRIVPMNFLFSDMTVRSFCQCFPITSYSLELDEFLQNPANYSTPMRAAPLIVQEATRHRFVSTRKKVWGLLDVLATLGLLEARIYGVDQEGQYRTTSAMNEATHIHLRNRAPLYNFGGEDVISPLVGTMHLLNEQQVIDWWYGLWQMSVSRGEANRAAFDATRLLLESGESYINSVPEEMNGLKDDLTKSIRWQTEYQLTKAQKRYLLAHVDGQSGESAPLSEKSVEEIAYRIVAPVDVVRRIVGKMTASAGRRQGATAVQQGSRIKRTNVQPISAVRVDSAAIQVAIQDKLRVRSKEIDDQWDGRLASALSETGVTLTDELKKYLDPIRLQFRRDPAKFNPRSLKGALNAFASRITKPAKEVIPSTAVRLMSEASASKKKPGPRKGERRRIKWTKDWDELALDAWVVVQARLSAMGLPPGLNGAYGALETVLPGVTADKIRLRIKSLRASSDGQSGYIDRLLIEWQKIAQKHKGTELLPDPNPDDPVNFDLLLYVEVLRAKIRKGIIARMPDDNDQREAIPLPRTAVELERSYTVKIVRKPVKQLLWEPHISEDRREAALISRSACLPTFRQTMGGQRQSCRQDVALEAAIKMIVAHPESTYHVSQARDLVTKFDKEAISNKITDMIKTDKVVALNADDPGKAVGRAYGFAPPYLAALEQPYPSELIDQAAEVAADFPEDAFVDWPLNCLDGQFAGALSLASNDMLNFEIDGMACNRLLSKKNMYQTKLIDDSDIELSIGVKLRGDAKPQNINLPESLVTEVSQDEAVVNKTLLDNVINVISESGADGMSPVEVFKQCKIEGDVGMAMLRTIFGSKNPPIRLVGYDGPRLVSLSFLEDWEVSCSARISEQPPKLVFPRQWVTLNGDRNEKAWERCVKRAFGVVMQKPGISERNLRASLSQTFDRVETNELLQYLVDEKRILRAFPNKRLAAEAGLWKIGLADDMSEGHAYFFPTDSMWLIEDYSTVDDGTSGLS